MTKIQNREVVDSIKLSARCALRGVGCIDTHPNGLQTVPALYEFDHLDPATKYRTKSGKSVSVADLTKGNRYSLRTVLAEIAKCRVLCVVCHRVHTHTVQRAN